MGLDITCDCEEISFRAGAYSGFGEFREALASMLGYETVTRYWIIFGTKVPHTTYDLESMTPNTPFWELFNHSDCEGELSSEECKALLEDFNEYGEKFLIGENYYTKKYKLWREACEHCAGSYCDLIFC